MSRPVFSTVAVVTVLLPGLFASTASGAVTLLGSQYRPDRAFPEHECFWRPNQYPGPCSASSPMGATAHLFLRNDGASAVTVQDVTLAGISLETALFEEEQVVKRHPVSIYFGLAHGSITQQQFDTLIAAGEPVWYKADPRVIPAGKTAQVVVRLRQAPTTGTIAIGVVHSAGSTSTTVAVDPNRAQLAGVSFSADLASVYLYWRRGDHQPPATIRMNGVDVTANATTVSDTTAELAATVLHLAQPLAVASLNVFQGVYTDGEVASASARAWANPFIYGTWGGRDGPDGDYAAARAWIDEAYNHSVNSLVVQGGSAALKDYLKVAEGRQYAADHGYGFVIDEIGKWSTQNPQLWFIRDEPDAADSRVTGLASNKLVGSLADMAVETGEELRSADPDAPTTLNIDGTYTPYNWYNYGQVPDVLMTDPYYQARLREAIWTYPNRIPLFSKATYIHAVSQVAKSSCEPNPLHVVLYSCEYVDNAGGRRFPFAPPATKRIEVYYALAGGATGISYWWFLPGAPSNGLGAATADAQALWREMGLLGAEIRAAAPLLTRACPGSLAAQVSSGLWVRSLMVGTDTAVFLVVNDQYTNNEQGCHYTPVPSASLSVNLPAWLTPATAFEISAGGVGGLAAQTSGSQLVVDLGTVDVTRMVVVTADPQLLAVMQQHFQEEVQDRVCAMNSSGCAAEITLQPQSVSLRSGETAGFSVSAAGALPITYRWQKGDSDLSDTDRISGSATPTLTISPAQTGDAGSYRCMVTNDFGADTSASAVLNVTPGQPGDFDGDNDVDLEDFGHFQTCMGGPLLAVTDPNCLDARMDSDSDIDLHDVLLFKGCLRGADVPADPDCAG